ncbi:MAG: DUF599 family protein [Cohaesibacteraceae bacterium]|nr:DUF599 family protein [Cohaesibacteraceae bacterium]
MFTDLLTPLDIQAAIWFIGSWIVFSYIVDISPLKSRSLSFAMNAQRSEWMKQLIGRDLRMVDTTIMAGLQNGTAFFASTSLLAIGGTFGLLGATDKVIGIIRELPVNIVATPALWETKVICLMIIYIYAFFKFGWAYRLFNYSSILIGAIPPPKEKDTPESAQALHRAVTFNILGGQHFNRGLRAIFFSLGFLGWFVAPVFFLFTTTAVVIVLVRRQFFSRSLKALQ